MDHDSGAKDKSIGRVTVFHFITTSIGGLLAGSVIGGIGGLALGCFLALGYHRRGPSDPGDAPAYVTMGLIVVGAGAGAIIGFVIGIIYSMRSARKTEAITG